MPDCNVSNGRRPQGPRIGPRLAWLAAICSGSVLGCSSDPAVTSQFDLGGELSFVNNPNGPWRYGYSAGADLSRDAFRLDTAAMEAGPVSFWHPAADAAGYYPYIGKSFPDAATSDATHSWALRPRQVALEASPSGQYSVIEFVASQAGAYEISATFEGIHFRLSTTDVHVRLNDRELFRADIEGYGGDPAAADAPADLATGAQSKNSRATYRDTVQLHAEDHLSFAVGCGPNRSNTNDTTGLSLQIRRMD